MSDNPLFTFTCARSAQLMTLKNRTRNRGYSRHYTRERGEYCKCKAQNHLRVGQLRPQALDLLADLRVMRLDAGQQRAALVLQRRQLRRRCARLTLC